ncbi:MAG: hypothetical protein JWP38_3565 [Herbaspirillum sp.]|nr:hypothetical protein [Herbaspirillum sp.]
MKEVWKSRFCHNFKSPRFVKRYKVAVRQAIRHATIKRFFTHRKQRSANSPALIRLLNLHSAQDGYTFLKTNAYCANQRIAGLRCDHQVCLRDATVVTAFIVKRSNALYVFSRDNFDIDHGVQCLRWR